MEHAPLPTHATTPTVRALLDHLDLATRNGTRVVRVVAPEGGGKTRLLEETMTALSHTDVFAVRGLSWEKDTPGWIAQRLVERLPTPATRSGRNARITGFESQNRIAGAMRRAEPGTVFVVDDAHFADVESLRAIGTALQLAHDSRNLVLLLVDDSGPAAAVALTRELADRDLVVPPLRIGEVRGLLGERAGANASTDLARQIVELTGGEPASTLALVEHLGVVGLGPDGRVPLPESLAGPARETLAALSSPARDIVGDVAILGTSASWSDLAALRGIDDESTLAASLDEACTARVLTLDTVPGHARVRFAWAMLRHVVLDLMAPTELRRRHTAAIELFTDRDEDAALAHRAALATGADPELSGRHARRAGTLAEEGRWYEAARALLTASALDDDPATADHHYGQGIDGLVESGHVAEATALSLRVRTARGHPERDAVLGYLSTMRGKRREAGVLLERAREALGDRGNAGVTSLASKFVVHSLAEWNPQEMIRWSHMATSDADGDPTSIEAARAIGSLGERIAAADRVDDGTAPVDTEGTAALTGYVQRFELAAGWAALAADDPASARRHLESAASLAPDSASERITIQAQAWLATAHLQLGTWDDALRIVGAAARRTSELGFDLLEPLVHGPGAMIRTMRDDPVGAARHIVHLNPPGDSYPLQTIPSAMAAIQVAAARGDYAEVRRAGAPLVRLGTEIDIDQPGYWPWFELYAHALVLGGRLAEAETLLDRLWERAEPVGHATTLAAIDSVRGRIAGIRGEHALMSELLESSIERVSPLGIPFRLARLQFGAGQTLRRAGRRREADNALGIARDLYEQFGASVYVRRCDRERKAGGINVERAPRHDLTPQERAVAALVAAGNSNAAAADELYLSVKTVQYHLTRIYAKLGVRGRAELAAVYSSPPGE